MKVGESGESIPNLANQPETVEFFTNAVYTNKSGKYGDYYRKRTYCLSWTNEYAWVRFAQNARMVQVSRNHLILDH